MANRTGLFAMVAKAAIFDKRLSAFDLKCLNFIATHANNGIAYPGLERIAEFMGGCSIRQAQRYVSKLIRLGYLSREVKSGKKRGRWPQVQFRLHYPAAPNDMTSDVASQTSDMTSDVASEVEVTRHLRAGDATSERPLMRHELCHPNKTKEQDQGTRPSTSAAAPEEVQQWAEWRREAKRRADSDGEQGRGYFVAFLHQEANYRSGRRWVWPPKEQP